jgi:tetrahydromethanopterin S-methyltransferase subunit G
MEIIKMEVKFIEGLDIGIEYGMIMGIGVNMMLIL